MPQTYNIEIPDVGYFERQVACRVGCPVHTDAGGYVQAIAQGRYESHVHNITELLKYIRARSRP